MKLFYISALCMAALTIAVGCTPAQRKSESDPSVTSSLQDSTYGLFGTYRGTFPCADCPGKEISLSVMEDGTYSLVYEYLETGEGTIEENGTYNILRDSIIETITPSSGEKTYYVYVHGNLVLTDSLGNINEGELADMYVLKKQ